MKEFNIISKLEEHDFIKDKTNVGQVTLTEESRQEMLVRISGVCLIPIEGKLVNGKRDIVGFELVRRDK